MQILGELGMGGIPGADVEHAVRTESDAAAVMEGAGRDSLHDVAIKFGVVTEVLQTNDGVGRPSALLPRQHGIDVRLLLELRMEGQAHQAALTVRRNLQRRIRFGCKLAVAIDHPDLPAALADQGTAVGKKDKGPRNDESRDPGRDGDTWRLGDVLLLYRLGRLAQDGCRLA